MGGLQLKKQEDNCNKENGLKTTPKKTYTSQVFQGILKLFLIELRSKEEISFFCNFRLYIETQ